MKIQKAAMIGLVLAGLCGQAMAVPPCVDRPTPPPCCADGRCYPSPMTFGYYDTHWRRWPLENVGENTPQTGEQQLKGVIPPFQSMPAEEEDRKAPPPTSPNEEVPPVRMQPSGTAPNGASTVPGSETRMAPNAPPPRQPGDQSPPTGPPRLLQPYEPQAPGSRPSTGTGGTNRTGEADPPPALPFGPVLQSGMGPAREARREAVHPTARAPRAANVNSSNDDPPPALPGTFANLSN
jgi:hypothetical protein